MRAFETGCWCWVPVLVLRAGCARGGDRLLVLVPGAGAGAGCQVLVSADCPRCGGAVSWLRRRRTFLFQPVACQQVVGFCLAIWVYASVIRLIQ